MKLDFHNRFSPYTHRGPIISDSISIVLLEEILRILAFRFNTKKLGFEVFWIGAELDHLLLEEIFVIIECRLEIV